jgi:phospholipid/cholesterol/gamma-HCH transport system permease protein
MDDMGGSEGKVRFHRPDNETLLVRLEGTWNIGDEIPSVEGILRELNRVPGPRLIRFDDSGLDAWDSSLLTFLATLRSRCTDAGVMMELEELPQGVVSLLKLAAKEKTSEKPAEHIPASFLHYVGTRALHFSRYTLHVLEFLGASFRAFYNLFRGKARYRRSDFGLMIYECGAQALPIVSLISILVGLILGFVGIVQLRMFGAQIYIANLVGISMAREMGAMMTAIIMMGRTGAAYATQLGTMETNEEIDALKTLGINPMEFLVMPRMSALILMMPFLCVYADFIGILGGAFVGVGMADIPLSQYFEQTRVAVHLRHFVIGVVKSVVFAVIIAVSGCYQGMHSDRSASAVGYAATRSVVIGIVLIVVTDGIFAVVTSFLRV